MFAQGQFQVTGRGNCDRVGHGLGQVTEQIPHFLRAFQILLIGVVAGPALIRQGVTLVDADPCFMGVKILPGQKANGVGRHYRQVHLHGQIHGLENMAFIIIAATPL